MSKQSFTKRLFARKSGKKGRLQTFGDAGIKIPFTGGKKIRMKYVAFGSCIVVALLLALIFWPALAEFTETPLEAVSMRESHESDPTVVIDADVGTHLQGEFSVYSISRVVDDRGWGGLGLFDTKRDNDLWSHTETMMWDSQDRAEKGVEVPVLSTVTNATYDLELMPRMDPQNPPTHFTDYTQVKCWAEAEPPQNDNALNEKYNNENTIDLETIDMTITFTAKYYNSQNTEDTNYRKTCTLTKSIWYAFINPANPTKEYLGTQLTNIQYDIYLPLNPRARYNLIVLEVTGQESLKSWTNTNPIGLSYSEKSNIGPRALDRDVNIKNSVIVNGDGQPVKYYYPLAYRTASTSGGLISGSGPLAFEEPQTATITPAIAYGGIAVGFVLLLFVWFIMTRTRAGKQRKKIAWMSCTVLVLVAVAAIGSSAFVVTNQDTVEGWEAEYWTYADDYKEPIIYIDMTSHNAANETDNATEQAMVNIPINVTSAVQDGGFDVSWFGAYGVGEYNASQSFNTTTAGKIGMAFEENTYSSSDNASIQLNLYDANRNGILNYGIRVSHDQGFVHLVFEDTITYPDTYWLDIEVWDPDKEVTVGTITYRIDIL